MTDPFRPLKDAFGRFATGVTVAGCAGPGGRPVLITVNSFASVSLDPPLVLWCIERRTSTFPAFMSADAYSVSVLRADQQVLSERFALHDPPPLLPHEYEIWATGAPILKERLAAFDCRITSRHVAGDHVILVAEVVKFEARDGAPLLYFASRYSKGPEAEQ
jgi:flavin reductase (DIM6/NTAB) family NADH-FMN oxidoreductase RutF